MLKAFPVGGTGCLVCEAKGIRSATFWNLRKGEVAIPCEMLCLGGPLNLGGALIIEIGRRRRDARSIVFCHW